MEAEQRVKEPAVQQSQPNPTKSVRITFEEFQKLSVLICQAIKELEQEGQDSVAQGEIVNRIARTLVEEDGEAQSIEKMAETAKKISNCINHLITKEHVLMIT